MRGVRTDTRRVAALAAGFTLCLATPVAAEVWGFLGTRYQGMGGAGVAVVDDSFANYWNPGALGFQRGWDVQLPVSAGYSVENNALTDLSNVIQEARRVNSALDAIDSGAPLTETELQEVLSLVSLFPTLGEDGQSMATNVDFGLTGHRNGLGISALSISQLNVQPVFDSSKGLAIGIGIDAAGSVVDATGPFTAPSNVGLATEIASANPGSWGVVPGGETLTRADQFVYVAEQAGVDTSDPGQADLLRNVANSTAQGETTITSPGEAIGAAVQGLSTQEFGVGYGHTVPVPFLPSLEGKVAIGGVLKYMLGVSFSQFVEYNSGEDVENIIRDLADFDQVTTSSNVGLDLGMLVQPTDWLRWGLTARNVNSPSFDTVPTQLGNEFELSPQVRTGVAVMPLRNWILAADVDLTENDSLNVPGFRSRLVSVGTEYTIPISWFALSLRVGSFANIADNMTNDIALTGGFGLRFGNFGIEFAAGGSFHDEEFDTGSDSRSQIPSRFNAGVLFNWQSRPEGTRRDTGKFTTPRES
ncbi:conjugal transfer protein TraF [Myxococcota bacterium]|nr:conjugal transfer protein TraF [Myxococcota bacterium]